MWEVYKYIYSLNTRSEYSMNYESIHYNCRRAGMRKMLIKYVDDKSFPPLSGRGPEDYSQTRIYNDILNAFGKGPIYYSAIIMASYGMRAACPWRPLLKGNRKEVQRVPGSTHEKLILSAFFFYYIMRVWMGSWSRQICRGITWIRDVESGGE